MQVNKLQTLKDKLMESAGLVQQMLKLAIIAETPRDNFEQVRVMEDQVNSLENEIDAMAINLIALYQPEAGSLRRIVMMYRINVDLERLGDQAFNIAESAQKVPGYQITEPQIFRMQEATTQMLDDAINAFLNEDVSAAEGVCANDHIVDDLNREIYHLVIAHIQEDPQNTSRYLHLLRIAKNLERCADLATNIAENTVYLVRGRIIRHQPE
ncbi:MAG: phosphate signaling complex protein PhoU [Candidatus Cloacimonetes bacterium]|nr:phosphate signaling complex protein PhoU [Candidatus Cloacimonadota bacterium]MDY0336584.1 phosphate signaling complex protein PhoU [Candidatus Cloacimonadaceae bacterium]MCB5270121.1 phosphate signaling complex protein PhoU [Candidatus Cloacimonadota bacterium]MCK9334265.1 phosphate signaling complex protein PhoU [Candidatus Cloacimonadota bacterium]MDD2543171.1 phosphate signaling complex protein PhoU [Candidatus Cloacimonadota bacterium]